MKFFAIALAFFALGFSYTPAHATISSIVNVTDTPYCTSPGSGHDQDCINSAISYIRSIGGGTVYFPCAVFATNAPIIIGDTTHVSSNIRLKGSGKCTVIKGSGNFNTVVERAPNATSSATFDYYGNSVSDVTFDESEKTGGYTLDLSNVAQLSLTNLYVNFPWCGPHINDFNNVIVENVVIYSATGSGRGSGCQAFLVSGGGTGDPYGRSDVITFKDFAISGNSGDRTNSHHGLIIDGFVATVSGSKIYLTSVDGVGLWFRNSVGASQGPEFATLYGVEADFPYANGILVQQGSVLHFTDLAINGSLTASNIYLANGVSRVSLQGGFSSNAAFGGIDSFATQVSISNMDIFCNSTPAGGGVAGAWSGLSLESSTRVATVTGNKIGCPHDPSWQKYGVQVNSGADQYVITSNALENNSLGGISGASGTASKIIANNAQ